MRREVPDVAQLDVLSGPGNDPSAAGYDHTTVIYDVLLTARNARVLLIGPPLLNLADVLWPATFTLVLRGGRQVELKPRREDRSHYFIAHMRVPRRHRSDVTDNSILRVRFADGSTYDVRPNPVDETPVALSLSTQQRDESTVWLRQWAAYWHSLGADRVIIYDNGSSYFSELPQLLADVAQDLSIVVVRWHFEFGPPRGFAYHYAQWASLNHARLAFPGARWGAAFDVDEYPVLRKDGGLIAFLDRQSRATGLVLLKLFDVKNIRWTPASDGEPPSAADFVYRSREAKKTFKYFYRTKWTRDSTVHSAGVRPLRQVVADPAEAAYLHYWALNRGWRHPERLESVVFDPAEHVEDRAVADRLRSLDI
jgi:hypothetical protein